MNSKVLYPKTSVKKTIHVSGDKSISHRALIIGAISNGKTKITNFSNNLDCLATINCLKQLGVKIYHNNKTVVINGVGFKGLKQAKSTLNVKNSGTTIRMLSAILAAQNFETKITGDNSLKSRPMNRIILPLSEMGAKFNCEKDGFAPFKIIGTNKLKAINYTLPIPSAQVKSAIMLAGLYANGKTTIIEKTKSRNHTEIMLKQFGANIITQDDKITVSKTPFLNAQNIEIPNDISSASFFIVTGLIMPNSFLILKNIGLNPTRTGLIKALKQMGANINILNEKIINGEVRGDIFVKTSKLKGCLIQGDIIPTMIDEIPILAVSAVFADGKTSIRDIDELKFKESNRIDTICCELKKMGANISKNKLGIDIVGTKKLNGAKVESYNDHRIAMSLAIAALLAKGKTILKNHNCVNISFPNFFDILDSF